MGKPKKVSGGSDVYAIKVFGDKEKQLEPAEHRILFPTGYVGITRTANGEYWAHIGIFKEYDGDDEKKGGRLVDARIDLTNKSPHQSVLGDLNNPNLYHLAIRVAPAEKFILEVLND